jgi:predicted nucleotide-binding protein
MPPRRPSSSTPPPRPMTLSMPRAAVKKELETLAERYQAVHQTSIGSEEILKEVRNERDRINAYANTFLRKAFHDEQVARDFSASGFGIISMAPQSLHVRGQRFVEACKEKISDLQSIIDQLNLYDEPGSPIATIDKPTPRGSEVFIVHGHNAAVRESVARAVETLGLPAMILHEQPNAGRTIIEKLEAHQASGFAIILLTADDLGCSIASAGKADAISRAQMEQRARQNVLFEAGLFIGLLTRKFVCLLKEPGVSIPTDLAGYVWTEIDAAGLWKYSLAKELKAAGFDVDMNKL